MNLFFWTLWYISLNNNPTPPAERDTTWPVWPMAGWGIGVFFHCLSVYKYENALAEKEYQKLKNKQ